MADFAYCTAQEAFEYGNSAGTATDPVNEASVMERVVLAISRAIDTHCQQRFSQATYTDHIRRARIDPDGVLVCYPAVPVMEAPTALSVQIGGDRTWTAMDLAEVDLEATDAGCILRAYSPSLAAFRSASVRVRARLDFTGGYATRDDLPVELRWAAQALAYLTFQRRTAGGGEQTAIPELGIVITPGVWPADVRRLLQRFVKVTP